MISFSKAQDATYEEFISYIDSVKRNYAANALRSIMNNIAAKEPARNDVNKVNDQAVEDMVSLSWYVGYSECQLDILNMLLSAIHLLEEAPNNGADRTS